MEETKPESHAADRVPFRGHYTRAACQQRRAWVREQTGRSLEQLGSYDADPQALKGNVENFVGMVQVPVGVAGPLLVHGDDFSEPVYAPFATTEGALVASASRGAEALTASGGVHARVMNQVMVRAPVFVLDAAEDARKLDAWISRHEPEIRAQAARASNHAELTGLQSFHAGDGALHVRFAYRTGDAAGQNMTTACTWAACQWILEQVEEPTIADFLIEGNMSSDKKASRLSYEAGRGLRVVAACHLPEEVLERVLKVSSGRLVEAIRHLRTGARQAGTIGFNVNVANAIAAIFTATGQDIACVHESSVGRLDMQRGVEGGVQASMLLPALIAGTVGGGTHLPTQRESLALMGCAGAGKVNRFAAITAGFCLALDLSTAASIAAGQFAAVHERLGRNRPDAGLKARHLTEAFFEEALASEASYRVEIEESTPFDIDTSGSILSDMTSSALKNKKIGHFPYRVAYRKDGKQSEEAVVVKAKPTGAETVNMINKLAKTCGGALASTYEEHKWETGFRNCHIRELAVCSISDARFTDITPTFRHTWRDDDREIFVLVMEYLDEVTHLNTENDIGRWSERDIKVVLRDLAGFHSIYYEQTDQLELEGLEAPTAAPMTDMMPLWKALIDHHAKAFPSLYTEERARQARKVVDLVPAFWQELEQAPKTLIHNDFNLRNLCLRPTPAGKRLCVYDWEMAAIHVPQHDVAEFLSFVLPPDTPREERLAYLEYYRSDLEEALSMPIDRPHFEKVFNLTCLDLLINRFALYVMAHTVKDRRYLPRVLDGHFRYVQTLFE